MWVYKKLLLSSAGIYQPLSLTLPWVPRKIPSKHPLQLANPFMLGTPPPALLHPEWCKELPGFLFTLPFIYYCDSRITKCTVFAIFQVQLSGLRYIHTVIWWPPPSAQKCFPLCRTETLSPLNSDSPFPCTSSPWQPPFYFPSMNLAGLGMNGIIVFVFLWLVYII